MMVAEVLVMQCDGEVLLDSFSGFLLNNLILDENEIRKRRMEDGAGEVKKKDESDESHLHCI